MATEAKDLGYDFSGVEIPENTESEAYGLRYAKFVVPLMQVVKELEAQNKAQQIVISENAQVIATFEERLASLEQKLEFPLNAIKMVKE